MVNRIILYYGWRLTAWSTTIVVVIQWPVASPRSHTLLVQQKRMADHRYIGTVA